MIASARRYVRSLIVLTVVLAACGGDEVRDDASEADATSEAVAERETEVVCDDGRGDVEPLLASQLDDAVALAADLIETRMSVDDDALLVEWTFAEGAADELEEGGNLRMEAQLEPAAGGNPVVTLEVARSAGGPPVVGLSAITEEGGPTTTEDVDALTVEERGDSLAVRVPVEMLYAVGNKAWQWSSTTALGRADPVSGEQHMGQDACGSTDAGAGSEIIHFPGPDLPSAVPPKEEATAPMCDRIPPVGELEGVLGIELGEPTRRYATECVHHGVVDPTDYVSFSTFDAGEVCTGSETTGELGDVPYAVSGGVSGSVRLCLPGEDLQVTTSIGSIDDDDGPLALAVAEVWVSHLEP